MDDGVRDHGFEGADDGTALAAHAADDGPRHGVLPRTRRIGCLADNDRALRLRRAYWYTWASSYERGAEIFRFAGLYRYADGRFDAKPALAEYRASARRDQ